MLIIISDLHLQDTLFDCVRYHDGDVLNQIGVRRNVKAAAFERLIARIREAARRRRSEEIQLVFAGDIFELHRAPTWFFGPDNHVRPTDHPVGEDVPANPLRKKVGEILNRLEEDEDHAQLWKAVQAFVRNPGPRLPRVDVHYLPGNHDRLANAWPTVRQQVRRMLGMDPTLTDPFPVRLDFTGPAPGDYGVRVRHGHEDDPANFPWSTKTRTALDQAWHDYLRPAFGDYVTVDIAMRLALAFRARYARAMRGVVDPKEKLPAPDQLRRLYLALTEFDDVRPASLLTDYLAARMGPGRNDTFRALKPILRDVIETAVANRSFMTESARDHATGTQGAMQLVFESLEPLAVQKELNGAELRVNFGVDDQGYDAEFKRVLAGTTPRPIARPPLPLDPNLDGDLWFYAVEVDWGHNPLDYDDPLPRTGPRGQFLPGNYALRIFGRGVGGTDRTELHLRYRIEPSQADAGS